MLTWVPAAHELGVAEMDATHAEFARLVGALEDAADADFAALFDVLAEHTERHFANESLLMQACRFPAVAEHESEHRRVLGEVAHIQRAIAAGRLRLARIYVTKGLPDWFATHLVTMDAALAACLRRQAKLEQLANG